MPLLQRPHTQRQTVAFVRSDSIRTPALPAGHSGFHLHYQQRLFGGHGHNIQLTKRKPEVAFQDCAAAADQPRANELFPPSAECLRMHDKTLARMTNKNLTKKKLLRGNRSDSLALINLGRLLTHAIAEVVEFGSAGLTGALELDLGNHRSMHRENAFYTDAVGADFADGEHFVLFTAGNANQNAFKDLETNFVAFFLDLQEHAKGVSNVKSLGAECH